MDENSAAAHFAKLQWGKTVLQWTLQIHNGEKLFRSALCKFKMEEISFAVDSANPQSTQHGQNGGAQLPTIITSQDAHSHHWAYEGKEGPPVESFIRLICMTSEASGCNIAYAL